MHNVQSITHLTLALLAISMCILTIDISAQSKVEILYNNKTSYRPYRITQDSENLYWMDGYELLSASKKTGQVRVVGKGSSIEAVLIESGGYIYKLDYSRITRFKSSGGHEEAVYQKPNYFGNMMAASSTGFLYWLTNQQNGGLVQVMSINDGKIATLTSGEKTSNFGKAIADDNSLYWIEPQTQLLKTVSAQGGKLRVMFSGCNDANHLAEDDKYVFFVGHQGLMRVPKAGSSKADLVAKLPSTISALAVDKSYIYYASWSQRSTSTGYISRIPKSGGAAEYVVKGLKTPNSLLVDSAYIYFADDENNMVARIPR